MPAPEFLPPSSPRSEGRLIYDLVVVGHGPAGCVVATKLARLGLKVLIIDRSASAAHPVGEALPPGGWLALEELGCAHQFSDGVHMPISGYRPAWTPPEQFERNQIYNRKGRGYVLDRARFDATLLDCVLDSGAHSLWNTGLHRITGGPSQGQPWRIECIGTAGTRTIEAALLVDATGRARKVGRHMGVRIKQLDHQITAVAHIPQDLRRPPPRAELNLECTSDGWWQAVPTPRRCWALMFSTDADLMGCRNELQHDLMAKFADTRVLRSLVGDPREGTQWSFQVRPAFTSAIDRFYGLGWVAVGDAAATFDPFASYGLSFALATASKAADAIHASDARASTLHSNYAAMIRKSIMGYLENRRRIIRTVLRNADIDLECSSYWRRRARQCRESNARANAAARRLQPRETSSSAN